jgi:hypothetical protein
MNLASSFIKTDDFRRREPRRALQRPGTIRLADNGAHEVFIADLTRDGCRIITDCVLTPDTDCLVGIANVGLTQARIMWANAEGYGCEFNQPLPPGLVTAAFGPTNVKELDTVSIVKPIVPVNAKWAPRSRLALLAAVSICGWACVFLAAIILVI